MFSWLFPAWAAKLDKIDANVENIMNEVAELKASVAHLKTEVGEAVAKFSEVAAALQAALENDGNDDELRAAVKEATVELEAVAKHLDDAFETGTFTPSGVE